MEKFTLPDSLIPDVYDPQRLNRYVYVLNNPLKYVDTQKKEFFWYIKYPFIASNDLGPP